jgi:hypothetical protein
MDMDTFDIAKMMTDSPKDEGLRLRYGTVASLISAHRLSVLIDGSTVTAEVVMGCTPKVGERVALLVDGTQWLAIATIGGDSVLHNSSLTGSGTQSDALAVTVPLELGSQTTDLRGAYVRFWRNNGAGSKEKGLVGFYGNTDDAMYVDNSTGQNVYARSYRPSDAKWSSEADTGGQMALTQIGNFYSYARLASSGITFSFTPSAGASHPWPVGGFSTTNTALYSQVIDNEYGTGRAYGIRVNATGLYFVSVTYAFHSAASAILFQGRPVCDSPSTMKYCVEVNHTRGYGSAAWILPINHNGMIALTSNISTSVPLTLAAENMLEIRQLTKDTPFGGL